MEERLRALELMLEQRQAVINEHERQLADLRTQMAVLVTKQDALIKKLDSFSSGVNRGLWIVGGGFLTALVMWVTNGGLHGGQ